MLRALLSLTAALACVGVLRQGADEPATVAAAEVRAAIQKSLPLLQQSARTWTEKRSCVSCHHQGLGVMAVVLARERGFKVDSSMLDVQVEHLARVAPGAREDVLQGDGGINAQIGQPYKLFALAAAGYPADSHTDARARLLAGMQQGDGHWRSSSHRPPLEDSEFTATAMSARTIQLYAPPGCATAIAGHVVRACAWLAAATPRSNEERAMQLFGLAWTGATPQQIASAREALIRQQRPDGGWAQISTLASDAYATGEALTALNQAGGLAVSDAAYQRGLEFLLRTQQGDGTWRVATRRRTEGLPYFETGFPHGEDQFISYAATCWAIMALCVTLEPGSSPVLTRTAALSRAAASTRAGPDDGVTPLMEAVLYDELDSVRALLDSGADIDVASKEGVTALMCAAGDVAKARLLVERGAKFDARSRLGRTAAIIAAGWSGGRDVLKLLLEKGADVNACSNDGTSALMRAALAGDRELIEFLLARGAKIDAADSGGYTALFHAATQGDAAVVRLLLERGASPDPKTDVGEFTPLNCAVCDGSTEVVQALLEKGAKVDERDVDGLTPLMLAAAIDYGDSAILEALIAKGADVRARTESGETPLAFAVRNGNARFAELLRKAGATE